MTLWQPWASLIAIGAKPWETRGRPPPRRLLGQRIAIHAAIRQPRLSELDDDTAEAITRAFCDRGWLHTLPLGAIVCSAVLAGGLPVEQVSADPFGDYGPGRWAWRLTDVRPVDPPVPVKGMQLWGWPWHVPENVVL